MQQSYDWLSRYGYDDGMMACLSKEFVYHFANDSYLKAFNLTLKDVVGKTVSDVFGEDFFESVIRPHALACFMGRKIIYKEWFNFPAYDEPRYMKINYYPFFGAYGKVDGFIVTARHLDGDGEKLP